MSFLDTMKQAQYGKQVQATQANNAMQKAAMYDQILAEKNRQDFAQRDSAMQQNAMLSGAQRGYQKAMQDMMGGLASQSVSNADQYGQAPQGVNVTAQEVAAIDAMGLPRTMESVMLLRTPSGGGL